MRIPLKWLSDYVDIASSPAQLAHRLTMAGLETEVRSEHDWSGVVVGTVLKVEPHPNADRLRLATVSSGEGIPRTVVCGAPNVAEGQKIAYAHVGAHLIDGHSGEPTILKPAKIRGVESIGMVCSERELGISDEHEGILVLPTDAPEGTPLADYLGAVILETSPTPNRPDWFSVIGTAHEVAAIEGGTVRWPDVEYETKDEPAAELASVTIEAPELCARYVATVIRNVRVGESPSWIEERLLAAGVRSINNVVDITNYVMLELGQPLHAFDYDRLHGHEIVVRRARSGESLITLDGIRRQLDHEMLVIADAERPLVIAGIFGGEDAEVGEKTVNLLLEAANFDPVSTRKTEAKTALRTEAGVRFAKGLSPALPEVAARRATRLFVELCGGTAAPGIIDVYPGRQPATTVIALQARLDAILGMHIEPDRVVTVLESLGVDVESTPDGYRVTQPFWRSDIRIADDVAEEVGRIIGYDELPTRLLSGRIPSWEPNAEREFRERVRQTMAAAGLQEVINYSMTNLEELQRVLPAGELEVRKPLKLYNPLSSEHELARTTLRASVLRTLSNNIRRVDGLLAIFELGRVYLPRPDDLPEEREMTVAAFGGRMLDRWGSEAGPVDFYAAKGYAEAVLQRLNIADAWAPASDHALLPGRTATLSAGGKRLGILGQLAPQVAQAFDLEGDVFLLELDIEDLRTAAPETTTMQTISRFPSVTRDVALLVDQQLEAATIGSMIEQNKLVASARPFDLFQGQGIPEGKKSLAFSVVYQASDHTLTDEEVTRAENGIIARLSGELGATPRSSKH